MTTDNRTNEPTPEQVEAAAKALYELDPWLDGSDYRHLPLAWETISDEDRDIFRPHARAALVAAAGVAPPAPSEYAYCPIHGDLLAANRSYRCGNAPTGHEYAAPVQPSSTVDGLQERIEDTLAYYQCRETNPKADHPSMGYHAFSEEQRVFLRARKSEAAAEIVRMILALLRGGGRR